MRPISTKELNYVTDHLSWELLMSKKCYDHANSTNEQEYKRLFNEAGQIHQQNYFTLLDYLQSVGGGQQQ